MAAPFVFRSLPASSFLLNSSLMRRFFFLWIAVLASWPVAAGEVDSLVRAIEARYHSARTLKAVFLHRYAESRNVFRVESGTVYFSRGGRMRWEYESPEEKLFVADGKTVWFYVPADRTVTRSKLRDSLDWHMPLALLVGKARFSRVCRRVELADVRVSSAENSVLRCLPKSNDAGFSDALIEVDAQHRLVQLRIREPGGIETQFRFANWQENLPLPDSFFRFVAPSGVAIVDDSSISSAIR